MLIFRKRNPNAKESMIGKVVLIWGNGEDLISDHTDNAATNEVVELAMKGAA